MGLFTGSFWTDNFFSARNPLILAAASNDFRLVHIALQFFWLKVHQQYIPHVSPHIQTSSILDALSFFQLQISHLTTPSRIPQVDWRSINACSDAVLVTSSEISIITIPHTHCTLFFSAFVIRAQSICPRCTAAYRFIVRPLSPPPWFLDVPTSAARCLHVHMTREILAAKGGTVGENVGL